MASSAAKGILWGSPTGVEKRVAGSMLLFASVVPPGIDKAAARVISLSQNSVERILALTDDNDPQN